MVRGIVEQYIDIRCLEDKHPDTWDLSTLRNDILSSFGVQIDLAELGGLTRVEITDAIFERLEQKYVEKEELVGPDVMRQTERIVMLQVIDNHWKDHLLSMNELQAGIFIRRFAGKDPLVEYKKESYALFTAMMDRTEEETLRYLFFIQLGSGAAPGAGVLKRFWNFLVRQRDRAPRKPVGVPAVPFRSEGESSAGRQDYDDLKRQVTKESVEDFVRSVQRKKEKHLNDLQSIGGEASAGDQTSPSETVGRNDPCPCGSGKKYKQCHGG
jgi:preprotein translocase subunit SecA